MALELMNDVPGFVQLRSATVVKGTPTPFLEEIFTQWIKQNPEDNQHCDYGENPMWLLAEMTDAGPDLETLLTKGFPSGKYLNKRTKGARLSLEQAWDIFFLTAQALASGEQYARFEHRDLHPGNICIKYIDQKSRKTSKNTQSFRPQTNIEVTIIDYTLSRANLTESTVLAHSMQDKSIFTQKSKNPNDQKQYDMYRWMRDIFEGTPRPKGNTSQRWKAYIPMTNVLWLHHLLSILLQETEDFGKDGTGYTEGSRQKMASTLANLRTELAPASVSHCDYLTATDVVRPQIAKKAKKGRGDTGDDSDYLGETEYMRVLGERRSERMRSAPSTS
ncbi:serine/threonine-protein kinase haspin, partial [Lecanoromycetidae sp. Uapishka_2]